MNQKKQFSVRGSAFYVGAQLAQFYGAADFGLGGSTTNVNLDSFIIHPGIGVLGGF